MNHLRRLAPALALTLAAIAPAHADPPFTCRARLAAARTALLAAHFDPSNDTPTWLQVRDLDAGGIMLNVYTVYSPDGDGYRTFEAALAPTPPKPGGKRPASVPTRAPWRLVTERLYDEFREERLPERTWTRSTAGWTATIHTRTENAAYVKVFESIVKPALDECLAHPGAVGGVAP